jgi:succinoglycan biosynthesis transport protein ExoP
MSIPDPLTRTFDGLASRVDAAGLRTVGFTSALLGEGVSTIALGTALSLARLRSERVLLIDANWLQPSLTQDADLGSARGLADHLAHAADIAELIRPGRASGIAFLPAGNRDAARPTLRALSTLLANRVSAYPTVVVDLPPVLAGEPFVLPWAALLDQLFLVLREAATPVALVRQALGKLAPTTPHIVLNRGVAPSVVGARLLAERA